MGWPLFDGIQSQEASPMFMFEQHAFMISVWLPPPQSRNRMTMTGPPVNAISHTLRNGARCGAQVENWIYHLNIPSKRLFLLYCLLNFPGRLSVEIPFRLWNRERANLCETRNQLVCEYLTTTWPLGPLPFICLSVLQHFPLGGLLDGQLFNPFDLDIFPPSG